MNLEMPCPANCHECGVSSTKYINEQGKISCSVCGTEQCELQKCQECDKPLTRPGGDHYCSGAKRAQK